jgi:hypothetical protein
VCGHLIADGISIERDPLMLELYSVEGGIPFLAISEQGRASSKGLNLQFKCGLWSSCDLDHSLYAAFRYRAGSFRTVADR